MNLLCKFGCGILKMSLRENYTEQVFHSEIEVKAQWDQAPYITIGFTIAIFQFRRHSGDMAKKPKLQQ